MMSTSITEQPAVELTALPEQGKVEFAWKGTNNEVHRLEEPSSESQTLLYLKMFSAGYSFFTAGVNDGSLGPIIPYMLREYNISTGTLSIM